MIYICIFLLVFTVTMSYLLENGDYMAPSFLMSIFFLLSVGFAWYMRDDWKFEYSVNTVLVIFIGVVSFIIGCLLVSLLLRGKRIHPLGIDMVYIYVGRWKIYTYYLLSVFFGVFFIRSIMKAVGGAGSWIDMMARYRFATAYQVTTGDSISIPSFIATGKFAICAATYIWIYILVNNYIIKKKWDIYLILAVISGLIVSILGASRLDLIRVPIALMIVLYVLKYRKGEINNIRKIQLLFKYIFIGFVVLTLFSGIRGIVGRKSMVDAVGYIAQYFAAPSVLFNEYMKNPTHSKLLFGKETFWGIYNFLGLLTKNSKYLYDYTLEFGSVNGKSLGNVYTAFRMYYSDFGYLGVIILSFFEGIIFSFLYNIIKRNIHINFKFHLFKKSIVDFRIIIYSVIVHSVILMFYADWFYSQVLAWVQIKALIFMWIIKIFLVDIDKKNKQTIT